MLSPTPIGDELPVAITPGQRRMFADCRILLIAVLVLAVVSQIAQHYDIGRTWYEFEFATLGYDAFVTSGFLGVAWCFSQVCSTRRNQLITIGLSLALEAALWAIRPDSWGFYRRLGSIGIGIGAASFLGLCIYAIWGNESRRALARGLLYIAGFLMLFSPVSLWGHFLILRYCPAIYDIYLLQLDGLWGTYPGLDVAQFVLARPCVLAPIQLIYSELPLILVWGILLYMYNRERCYNNLVVAFATVGVAGFALYSILPSVGLGHLFPSTFPHPDLTAFTGPAHLLHTDGIRNCMPSLHLSWMLCVLFGILRINRRVRALALAALALTIVATFTMCHYLVDLVMSFPLVLTFQALTCHSTPHNGRIRRWCIFLGLALLTLGFSSMRSQHDFLITHPYLTNAAEVLLVAICLAAENMLARQSLSDANATRTTPNGATTAPEPTTHDGDATQPA